MTSEPRLKVICPSTFPNGKIYGTAPRGCGRLPLNLSPECPQPVPDSLLLVQSAFVPILRYGVHRLRRSVPSAPPLLCSSGAAARCSARIWPESPCQ